jgi:hypothetical protein
MKKDSGKMKHNDESNQPLEQGTKKPYEAPEFRYERVFEVSALSCGKVSNTQASCHSNRKVS